MIHADCWRTLQCGKTPLGFLFFCVCVFDLAAEGGRREEASQRLCGAGMKRAERNMIVNVRQQEQSRQVLHLELQWFK